MAENGEIRSKTAHRTPGQIKRHGRTYQAKSAQKKKRAARNKLRRQAIRDGRVKKGDGKEIDHIRPMSKGGSNTKKNTRVVSRTANRKKGNK